MHIEKCDGDDLIEEIGALFDKISLYEFPELEVETVTDDGETYEALRCPRCGSLVAEDDLYAVDFAERWTAASDISTDNREVIFHFDEMGEFDSSVYYRHDDHAVNLPTNWTEGT